VASVLFFSYCCFVDLSLYKKVKVKAAPASIGCKLEIFFLFTVFLVVIEIMVVGGGCGFQKSTRPINVIDASRYVTKIQHAY